MGQRRKLINNKISTKISPANIIISAKINIDLKIIPINIENPTNPFLYSFFQGLKKVFNIRVTEKSPIKALFRDKKNLRSEMGASRYQNFIISRGSKVNFIGSILKFKEFEANLQLKI